MPKSAWATTSVSTIPSAPTRRWATGHRQRSKGKWEITIDIGRNAATGKRQRHFETVEGAKKDAQHRLAELLISIEQGTYVKQPKRLTVADWLREWLQSYVASNLAAKTKESYTQQLCYYVIPRLGGIRLGELRPHHIQDYIGRALTEERRPRRAVSVIVPSSITTVS